jgi:hypothetical protein
MEFTNSDPSKGSVIIHAPRRRTPIRPEKRRRCCLCGEPARKYGLCGLHAGYRYQFWRWIRNALRELKVEDEVEFRVMVDLKANTLVLSRGVRWKALRWERRRGRHSRAERAAKRQQIVEVLSFLFAGGTKAPVC